MKGLRVFLATLYAVGLSTASLSASTTLGHTSPTSEKECPFWTLEDMNSFFTQPFARMKSISTIKESDKTYLISIDLPGMDKKDISIERSGNRLVISGERKEESESKEGSKKTYRQFNQSFLLPDDANLDAITATSTNGVLKITVPKTGKKVSKNIPIK